MALMGLTREEAADFVGAEPTATGPRRVEVLAFCSEAVRLFTRLGRQWRHTLTAIAGPSGPLFVNVRAGLDMPGVDAVARWMSIAPSTELLDDLRVLEAEVLTIEAEARR